ncbi:WGR domain-containing protein [Nannocystaceae bacterium ST9]
MRRFEYKDSKSHKFWEVVVEGKAFTVRYGKVGTEGQTQTKSYPSEAKAAAEAEKKVAEKTKKGYVEVEAEQGAAEAGASGGADKAGARNPELEQAIFDEPGNRQAWAVYADWLQGQGDPWGERLSLALTYNQAKGPDKTKIKKAIDKLDEDQREYFLSKSFAKLMKADDFEQVAKLEWEYGFIVGARVAAPEFEWSGTSPDTILRALVKSPAARFLRSLTIGLIDFDYPVDVSKGVDAICKAGTLGAMRDLFVGDFEYPDEQEISWVEAGSVENALLVMPNLRSLHVRGGGIGLGKTFEHDKLETLLIETGGLPAAAVKALGKCRLPNLRKMEVWFGREEYGGNGTIKMLEPMFSGEGLPKLVHLGLMNSEFENEIAKKLARSPLLAQVKTVDLSMGTLHDVGGKAILDAADSFKHLEQLNLDHNYLSETMAKALKKALGKVVEIGGTDEPDMWDDKPHYYTQVGE